MSAVPDGDRIEVAALGELKQITSGKQGAAYAVPSQKILDTWDAAFTEYGPETRPSLDVNALVAVVEFARGLPGEQGRMLAERVAWPYRVVVRDGTTVGFLARAVPRDFRLRLRGPQGEEEHVAQVQHLLNGPEMLARQGVAIDDRTRLELLRDVAETLALLHSLSITVGDAWPRNLLFSARARPHCFFTDADSMCLGGWAPLSRAETWGWNIPAGEALGTPAADAYRFALLAIRLFGGDQLTRDPMHLARVSPDLVVLAQRGLSENVIERPLPTEWLGPLASAIVALPAAAFHFAPTQTAQPGPVPGSVSAPPVLMYQTGPMPVVQMPMYQTGQMPAVPMYNTGQMPALPVPVSAGPAPLPVPMMGPAAATAAKSTAFLWWPLAAVAAVALAVVLVPIVTKATRSHSSIDSGSQSSTYNGANGAPGGTVNGNGNVGPTAPSQGVGSTDGSDQVNAFETVLAASIRDRTNLLRSLQEVAGCVNVQLALSTLQAVASGRAAEIQMAEGLETYAIDVGDPNAARDDLVSALQYSLAADQEYVTWAEGRVNSGCSRASRTPPSYLEGVNQSHQADAQKDNFVGDWTPIAEAYGVAAPAAGTI